MSFRRYLLPLATFLAVSHATKPDNNNWQAWSSSDPQPVTVVVTEKSTETQYSTQTAYITITGPTFTETNYKTTTLAQTSTELDTIIVTETLKPVTQVDTVTITRTPDTTTQISTVTQVNTVPTTSIITSTVAITVTKTISEPITVLSQSIATIVNTINNPITVTSLSAVTQYVSVSTTCPTPTSGITTCPTRIINPTYTPAQPLPSNYLWGCPPGKLCHPKRENCNFEQNLPADTYICAPEECLPVADLPPLGKLEDYLGSVNDSCAWITPIDDYFNLNPLLFGLDFDIFNIYGQPKCTPAPPVTVTTVTATCASAPTWSVWSSQTTSARWGNWLATSTGSSAPTVTKRAELIDSIVEKKRAVTVPGECYNACNRAAAVWQSIGNVAGGCDDFKSAFSIVTACTELYNAEPATEIVTVMDEPINLCSIGAVKRDADDRLKAILTAGYRFARS